MKRIVLPDGNVAYLDATDDEVQKTSAFLEARQRFTERYLKERGWPSDAALLSFEQIMEIRSQPGWKTPKGVEPLHTSGTFVPTGKFN